MAKSVDRVMEFFKRNRTLGAALVLFLLALLFLLRVLVPPNGQVLGGYDMRGLFHVLLSAFDQSISQGEFPLWNRYLFNGFPLFADPQSAIFYPFSWLSIILPVSVGISWSLLFHIFLAGLGMFAFVRSLGSRWYPALLAGIIFAFGGILAGRLWAGHSIVLAVFTWTPWMLLALFWSVKSGSVWAGIIAGVPFGLAILAGHLPSFVYVSMIWAAFGLYLLITESSSRRLVLRQLALQAAVGFGLAAVQLIPTFQLAALSERANTADYEFATAYSFPPAHLVTLLVPEYFGEPLRIGYWSVPTFEELTYYAGILGILALALAFVKSDRLTWFYVILMIFGILVAMGSYGVVHRLLYNILPPFRLMRAPARAAFLFFFSASALTAHVLSKWMSASEEERLTIFAPNLRRIILIFSIIGVVSIAAIGAVFISIHPTETSGRLWHQLGGSAFAVTLVLLSGGLLYLLVVRKPGSIYQRLAVMAALLVILLVDLWTFSYKFVRTDPTGPDQLWLDAKEIIGETNSGVLPWGLSIFTQNGGMQTGLRSVFGYNSLSPGDHLALASSIPDPRSTAYDVLATEYVISEAPLDQFTAGDSGLILVDQTSSVKVYKRPSALAVSRIVYDFEVIPDSQEAIQRIHSSEFDASTTVILARKPGCDVTGSSGESSIEESSSGYWRIRSSSDGPGLLILAENAYPGWRAKIDGQDAEILTAYTSLKVVCVPAGDHIVEWNMTAGVLPAGIAISLGSFILVIIATVMVLKHRSNAPEESSN